MGGKRLSLFEIDPMGLQLIRKSVSQKEFYSAVKLGLY